MKKVLEFFVNNWIRFVVSIVIGVGVMVAFVASRNGWSYLMPYVNGMFIAGAVLAIIGIFALLTGFGAYNMLSFYFNRKKLENGHKENYYEYSKRKDEERKKSKFYITFLPYEIIGTLFILVSIVIYFICMK